MVSRMVTIPILGTDLHPRDRSPSQFYYISIRGSESESKPVEKSCILQESESESKSESDSGSGNKPLDWYYSRHHQNLQFPICDLLFTPSVKNSLVSTWCTTYRYCPFSLWRFLHLVRKRLFPSHAVPSNLQRKQWRESITSCGAFTRSESERESDIASRWFLRKYTVVKRNDKSWCWTQGSHFFGLTKFHISMFSRSSGNPADCVSFIPWQGSREDIRTNTSIVTAQQRFSWGANYLYGFIVGAMSLSQWPTSTPTPIPRICVILCRSVDNSQARFRFIDVSCNLLGVSSVICDK